MFMVFVTRETAALRRGKAGGEDPALTAILMGTPVLTSVVLFLLFLVLVIQTRNVVARGIAERNGVGYLLK